ncbi:MAG TPA: phospholipid carrier-dependent glycosyltransferase [Candidatus Binataceae bacterium]|nr:phospholipid carrier-dependent glycosyltransferase [Candidatus Binataceae bacterium]
MAARRRLLRPLLYAIAAALLYLPALGRPALWEPDEGRYGEIAREMVLSGDWITPRDNWVRYFEKPPLVYWAEAIAIEALGPTELAVRLPAALATVAEVVITAALAEAMFGVAAGLGAAAALALSPLVFGFARFATLDPPLALFITAALGAFWAAARAPDFGSGAGRRWFLLAAICAAAGTLTKGPVALLLAGAVGFAWLVWERRVRQIPRMPWPSAIALYLAIVVPWFVLVAQRNPGFLHFFFVHEHLQRYLESSEHGWGPYFFVLVVAGGMWPWICFVPLGVRELMRAGATADPPAADTVRAEAAADGRLRPSEATAALDAAEARSAMRFLLLWFGVIFVFFSIPRAKLGAYILPALPPLAILGGYGLCRLPRIGVSALRSVLGSVALLSLILAMAAMVALLRFSLYLNLALVLDGCAAAAALTLGAMVCMADAWRGRHLRGALVALAVGVVVALGFLGKARIDAQPLGSYRRLAREMTSYLGTGCRLLSYRHFVQSLPFYTGRREALVAYRGELAPFGNSPDARESFVATDTDLAQLWRSNGCAVLVANRTDLTHLRTVLDPLTTTIIGCEGKKVALHNRAIPLPAQARGCEVGP